MLLRFLIRFCYISHIPKVNLSDETTPAEMDYALARSEHGSRAPITSVLIIFEMTGSYELILPLMISNMSAYALARHCVPRQAMKHCCTRMGSIYHTEVVECRMRSSSCESEVR
jgi:voltage-gated chloride channel